MIKHLIKDISEKDFRALNIKVFRHENVIVSENIPGHPLYQLQMVEKSLNDILDNEIDLALKSGWPSDKKALEMPVYIAIHEENNADFSGYMDKFMNCYTGLQTFQIGWGIKHLYSTRDYYEAHEDYWKVRKKETAVIYRVQLEPREFVLKHKKEITKRISPYEYIEVTYDLNENGEWVPTRETRIIREGRFTQILPVAKTKEE